MRTSPPPARSTTSVIARAQRLHQQLMERLQQRRGRRRRVASRPRGIARAGQPRGGESNQRDVLLVIDAAGEALAGEPCVGQLIIVRGATGDPDHPIGRAVYRRCEYIRRRGQSSGRGGAVDASSWPTRLCERPSNALGINDQGSVVSVSHTSDADGHATLWRCAFAQLFWPRRLHRTRRPPPPRFAGGAQSRRSPDRRRAARAGDGRLKTS